MSLLKRHHWFGLAGGMTLAFAVVSLTVPRGPARPASRRIGASLDGETHACDDCHRAFSSAPWRATLAYKIEKPKFYAFYPLVLGITLTFGGIAINSNGQALEPDGSVIAGLFAAGENAGAVFYDDYFAGGSLTNCLVMGRIAGRQAALRSKNRT